MKWLDDFLHNSKVFIRKENAAKAYHHARTDEKSFLEGIGYAIGKLEAGDKMMWMKACDIDQYLEDKNRSILTRKENGWGEFEYSIQKIKELEGFKLTVFKAAGFQWSFIEKGVDQGNWYQVQSSSPTSGDWGERITKLPGAMVFSDALKAIQKTKESKVEVRRRPHYTLPLEVSKALEEQALKMYSYPINKNDTNK